MCLSLALSITHPDEVPKTTKAPKGTPNKGGKTCERQTHSGDARLTYK